MLETQVVVIGGGATGTGILRDLSLRGIPAILVEQVDLAHGTSSRFHGLLHSGARYAVKDPEAAKECIEENKILRRVAKTCIEDIEGLFVQLPQDADSYVEDWVKACCEAGIPVEEISREEALRLEPNLNPALVRAFKVPDGAVDGFRLVWANVASAERHGAQALTYNRVGKILSANGQISGVEIIDVKTQETKVIKCQAVINAAGPWAAEVAALGGVEIGVSCDKGTLLAFNHRITGRVINRLRPPGDGDIMVPHGTVAILGTTSIKTQRPNDFQGTEAEVSHLLDLGRELFPQIDEFRILRAFTGVRPLLINQTKQGSEEGRNASRGFAIVDHQSQGVSGFYSVVGGKLTTFRLMAEKTVDYVAQKLGVTKPCLTAQEELIPLANPSQLANLQKYISKTAALKMAERLGHRVAEVLELIEAEPWKKQMVCECEQVTLAEMEYHVKQGTKKSLNDLRRLTRMGMGTCQGTICTTRGLGQLYEGGYLELTEVDRYLTEFLQERRKGHANLQWGDQLRQTELMNQRYLNVLNLDVQV